MKYYLHIIEEILLKNVDTLDKTTLTKAKDRLAVMHPRLDDITFDDGLHITADLPDGSESMGALRGLLESIYDFLKNLIGADMANERVLDPMEAKVRSDRDIVERLELHEWFPQFLLDKEQAVDVGRLRDKDPRDQQVEVFSGLFTEYLREVSRTEDPSIFLKNAQFAFDKQAHFTTMGFDDDMDFQLVPADDEVVEHRQLLLDLFMSYVNLSAFTMGEDKANELGVAVTREVLGRFEEIPDKLGISDRIMHGAVAKRISTGMKNFDNMIEGGIPRGSSVLVKAPSGNEANLIFNQYIHTGLRDQGAALMVVSTAPVTEFRRHMEDLDYDTQKVEEKGRLKMVDWYSWKVERVNGVEELESGAVIKSSKILSNLSIAINRALKAMAEAPTKRAVVKFLTSALNTFTQNEVYGFAQKLRARFKENDVTAMFLIEKDAHDEGTVATFNEVFDGVLNLERERDGDVLVRKVCIESMGGTFFDTDYRELSVRGNHIDVAQPSRRGEKEEQILYEEAVDMLQKARAKIDSARSMDVNISGVEARFLGAKPLFQKKDYRAVLEIAQTCIEETEALSKEDKMAAGSEEEKRLYSKTVEMLKIVRERMIRLKELGADISQVEERFAQARPALSNKDYDTAMEVATLCNAMLEKINPPPPTDDQLEGGRTRRDEAIELMRRVWTSLKTAKNLGYDISKAESIFREGEKALREDDYTEALNVADRTLEALSGLKAEAGAEKLEKAKRAAQQAALEMASDGIIALQGRMLDVKDRMDAENERELLEIRRNIRSSFAAREYNKVVFLLQRADIILTSVIENDSKRRTTDDLLEEADEALILAVDGSRKDVVNMCNEFELSTTGSTTELRGRVISYLLRARDEAGEQWETVPQLDGGDIEDADRTHLMLWAHMLGLEYERPTVELRKNLWSRVRSKGPPADAGERELERAASAVGASDGMDTSLDAVGAGGLKAVEERIEAGWEEVEAQMEVGRREKAEEGGGARGREWAPEPIEPWERAEADEGAEAGEGEVAGEEAEAGEGEEAGEEAEAVEGEEAGEEAEAVEGEEVGEEAEAVEGEGAEEEVGVGEGKGAEEEVGVGEGKGAEEEAEAVEGEEAEEEAEAEGPELVGGYDEAEEQLAANVAYELDGVGDPLIPDTLDDMEGDGFIDGLGGEDALDEILDEYDDEELMEDNEPVEDHGGKGTEPPASESGGSTSTKSRKTKRVVTVRKTPKDTAKPKKKKSRSKKEDEGRGDGKKADKEKERKMKQKAERMRPGKRERKKKRN